MGMDANFWANPADARILGGKYPLRVMIPGIEMKTSFDDLRSLGFSVLAWSQKRPAGEAMLAFEELQKIADAHFSGPVILIGHSRGGLLARMLVGRNADNVKAVITIGSPHQGSTIARWAEYLSPLASTLKKIVDAGTQKKTNSAIQKVLGFLSSSGLKEMLPDSDFISALPQVAVKGIPAISIGGTDPSFIRIDGKTILTALSGIFPNSMLPDELRDGMGDGMVSALSAVWPGASGHRNYYAHHGALPFHKDVREYIVKVVTSLTD